MSMKRIKKNNPITRMPEQSNQSTEQPIRVTELQALRMQVVFNQHSASKIAVENAQLKHAMLEQQIESTLRSLFAEYNLNPEYYSYDVNTGTINAREASPETIPAQTQPKPSLKEPEPQNAEQQTS